MWLILSPLPFTSHLLPCLKCRVYILHFTCVFICTQVIWTSTEEKRNIFFLTCVQLFLMFKYFKLKLIQRKLIFSIFLFQCLALVNEDVQSIFFKSFSPQFLVVFSCCAIILFIWLAKSKFSNFSPGVLYTQANFGHK